jgi:hypothetical protein
MERPGGVSGNYKKNRKILQTYYKNITKKITKKRGGQLPKSKMGRWERGGGELPKSAIPPKKVTNHVKKPAEPRGWLFIYIIGIGGVS